MPLVETVFDDGRKDYQNAHRPRKRIRTANHRPRPLLFIVNSEIHPYVASRPDLHRCQVPIRASDYGFLRHDSFVDCSKVVSDFDEGGIRDQILEDIRGIKGELSADTKHGIIQVVQSARTIVDSTKG